MLRPTPPDTLNVRIKRFITDKSYRLADFFSQTLTNRNYFGIKLFYLKGNSIIDRIRFFKKGKVYEPELLDILRKYTKSSKPVFIDIGANIGLISIGYLNFFKDCRIIAFEPGPIQRFSFGSTILANNLFSNIVLSDVALSNIEGYETFITHGGVHNSGDGFKETKRSPDKGFEIVVKTDTLDNQVESLGLQTIDIIKIDVEGSELAVLKGSLKTIEKFKPIIVLEIAGKNLEAYNLTPSDLFKFIKELNYDIYTLKEEPIRSSEELVNASLYDDMFLIRPVTNNY